MKFLKLKQNRVIITLGKGHQFSANKLKKLHIYNG